MDAVSSTEAPSLDAPAAANVTYTFTETATASIALYGMSLFCIIIGGIRSAWFVRRQVQKKRLIEASIAMREAKKFPITASCVLFGLYLFFKPNGREWLLSLAGRHLPDQVSGFLNRTLAVAGDGSTASPGLIAKLPEPVRNFVTPYLEFLPTITKQHFMSLLFILICFEGCVALAALLKPFFSFVLRLLPIGNRWPRSRTPYLLALRRGVREDIEAEDMEEVGKKDTETLFKIEVDTHDVIAILACLYVGFAHWQKRHWIWNNIIGVAFSIYGIENLHLASFKAGSLLLAGLFVYDVFWVFGTDVMTSVAKGIDAPILLQFPQDIYRNGWLEASKHSMLGLGDIVIPGIFIALLRRFDLQLASEGSRKNGEKPRRRYYFILTVFAYAAGLLITMLVMHHFKAAQPALLYLVPTCLFTPLLFAVCLGDASALWNYNEEHLTEKAEEEKKEREKEKKARGKKD